MIKTKRTVGEKYNNNKKIRQRGNWRGRQEIKPNAGCRRKLIIVLVLFHCTDSLYQACVSHKRLPLTPIWFTVEIPFLSRTDFFTRIIYMYIYSSLSLTRNLIINHFPISPVEQIKQCKHDGNILIESTLRRDRSPMVHYC